MEDFIPFEIAKKLKEKGFECMYPIAMYNEKGVFHELYTSVGNMQYYDYDDFDERDTIAPTISQVLKWLRREKKIHIEPCILADADTDADGNVLYEHTYWSFSIMSIATGDMIYFEYEHIDDKRFDTYESAALAGVAYCLENLI